MKKSLIVIGAFVIVILMISTATAIPKMQSEFKTLSTDHFDYPRAGHVFYNAPFIVESCTFDTKKDNTYYGLVITGKVKEGGIVPTSLIIKDIHPFLERHSLILLLFEGFRLVKSRGYPGGTRLTFSVEEWTTNNNLEADSIPDFTGKGKNGDVTVL